MTAQRTSTVDAVRRELAAVLQRPRSQATAMPAAYYTSAEYLELEKETLFRKQWICIGHVGEVPNAGDFFTTELVGEPLLVVRQATGGIAVLSNVCRHRGHLVAEGKGTATRFVCGYHGWSYTQDGRLLAAPLIKEGPHFSKKDCRLPEIPSTVWDGYLFVNLDRTAPPLLPDLAATEANVRNYQPNARHFLFGAEEVWDTNWKCLVENFMEGYHLSPLHATTLHPITPTKLCEKLPDGAAFTGYRSNFDPTCPERGPYPPELTEQERRSDVFYCIYPSFVVGLCPHFTLHMCIRPLTVDRVGIRWGVTGVTGDPDSPEARNFIETCKAFCKEDRSALESLQVGMQSRLYRPGPLAPDAYEGTVLDLMMYMARHMASDVTSSTLSND